MLSVVDNVSVDTFVVPYTLSDGSLVNAIEDLRVIANTLIIPNTVNIIGGQCCAGIKEVIIPRSVKEIRGGAFQNSFITEIIIPKNVEKIYEFSFFDIAELKYVYFENDNVEFCYLNAFPENGDCIFGITDFSGDEPQTIVNPNLTFICNPGSTAEAYAKENGIKYAYDYIDPTTISNSDDNIFWITATGTGDNFDGGDIVIDSADKTPSEVITAYNEGKNIKLKLIINNYLTFIIDDFRVMSDKIEFCTPSNVNTLYYLYGYIDTEEWNVFTDQSSPQTHEYDTYDSFFEDLGNYETGLFTKGKVGEVILIHEEDFPHLIITKIIPLDNNGLPIIADITKEEVLKALSNQGYYELSPSLCVAAISNTGLSKCYYVNSDQIDNIRQDGMYYVYGDTSGVLFHTTSGMFLSGGSRYTQILMECDGNPNSTSISIRHYAGIPVAWTEWKRIEDFIEGNYYTKDEIDDFISDVGQGVTDFQATITEPTLGEELASNSGWTTIGWTGDFENGFVHTVGQTTPLIYQMPESTGTNLYQIEFDVTDCSSSGSPNASTAFSVILGNSVPFITYDGGGPKHYSFGIRSVSDGDLQVILTAPADPFTTDGSFNGTIKNISIKRILEPYPALIETKDADGDINIEIRANDIEKENFYMGKNAGQYNTSGNKNVGIGNHALEEATSAYWNVAIGAQAMQYTNVGSRSVGIGRLALQYNNGDRNYAIGTFALQRNTSGRFNVAIGADTLWVNTSGCRNIAIGSASQSGVKTSNDNISIGHNSMALKPSGDQNIAIGTDAQRGTENSTGRYNIAIGYQAQYKGGGAENNVNIGYGSGGAMEGAATSNVSVGNGTLVKSTEGKYNVAIGHYAGNAGTTFVGNTFVGCSAGQNATGSNNVTIGREAGKALTSNNNVLIGTYTGRFITTGKENILIGYNVATDNPTDSWVLNIGNLIKGSMNSTNKYVNIDGDLKIKDVDILDQIGSIELALDELHNYAQALINGGGN